MGYTTQMAPGTVGQAAIALSTGSSVWTDLGNQVGKLVNGVFNVSGSGYPKPAPPPLPFTVSQVTAMLQSSPTIYASLVKHIMGASPVDVRRVNAGTIPTKAQLQGSPSFAAQIGLALANAQGAPKGNISVGEANVRAVITQGMYNAETAQQTGTGGGTTIPGPPPRTASSATIPALLGLGLVGAVVARRRR